MSLYCSKCLSKAKACLIFTDFITAKLVQSVKLNPLSAYCLKMPNAALSTKAVTVMISIRPLFRRFSRNSTAIS